VLVRAGSAARGGAGLAVDLGTTTVALALADTVNGGRALYKERV
jgi:hypothetical protein